MSIQANFPALKPTLLLDFANTEELDPRITFTRASTATYYGTQTAKAEENLLLQSQNFTTSWINSNSTDAADVIAAPDGTLTADSIIDNATNAAHVVRQAVAYSINTTYVVSCFLKAGTSNYAYLGFFDPVTAQRYFCADFDLSGGTVRTSAAGTSGTLTAATITSAGSGWYRCVVIGQVSEGTNQAVVVGVSDGSTAFSTFGTIAYVGTGSDIYAWGAQLEQRSSVTAYTPTTTQPITNYIPVLETAASGVARFDHNPTTFESLGLLIEESRTNLILQSEDFSTTWTNSASTEQTNVIVSPAGTLTGDKIVSDSGSLGYVVQTVSQTSGTSYALSVFAKAGEYSFCQLRINTSVSSITRAYFNLSNGTTTGATNCTASITPVGNGWYRCSIVYTATVTTALGGQRIYGQVDASDTVGDGYSGIYIWGAQLEAGSFATSYIPTVASQVTRAADAASMTGTNFSSWFNQAEGTFFSSVVLNQTPATLSGFGIYAASDNTQSNRVFVNMGSGSGGNINALVATSGVTQAQTINASLSTAGAYLYANAYKVNDFASVANGGVAVTDTSGTVPVVNRLYLGASAIGTPNLNSTIRKIAYYPLRLTNTNLQALTS